MWHPGPTLSYTLLYHQSQQLPDVWPPSANLDICNWRSDKDSVTE